MVINLNLSLDINNEDELLHNVNGGFLIVHEEDSGAFLMLRSSIESICEKASEEKSSKVNYYSVSSAHKLFDALVSKYSIQQLPALLIIRDSKVVSLKNSPITKIELLKQISNHISYEKV